MTEEENAQAAIAQTEKFGLGDLAISGLVAALVWIFQKIWEFPGLHPGVWNDALTASWTRPATHVMPGYWTTVADLVYRFFGFEAGNGVLRVLGHAALAVLAVLTYLIFREILAFMTRARPQFSRRRTLVMRFASVVGTAGFIAADPVWNAGQCLSENTILMVLTQGAIWSFLVLLRKGSIKYAYLSSLLIGLLSAETPFGFLLPILFVSLNVFVLKVVPALESPFFKPTQIEVGKWYMTFLCLAGLVAGIALNCWMFVRHGGLGANGLALGDVPLRYLLGYWGRLTGAAGPVSWLLWVAVCLAPFVVVLVRFPAAADEEKFLPYATGIVFFICGILALSQSAFLPALWFWTYFPVDSDFLLMVGLACSAATLAFAMTILGVDALCRDHQRLARQLFGNEEEEGDAVKSRSTGLVRRSMLIVIPLFVIAVMVPGRIKSTTREMLVIIRDAVQAIVAEAGGVPYLVTGGHLDSAIELESHGKLKCLSLVADESPMAGYLRIRGMEGDAESVFSFGRDTGMGLRTWIRDKPEKLASVGVMMGFDLWKRDGKPIPPMGGFMSLPGGYKDESVRKSCVEAAIALAERVLAVHRRRGGIRACTNKPITDAFLAVQWRLARMCVSRGEYEDFSGQADAAIADANLAKRLNDLNPIYRDILKSMEQRNDQIMRKLTPREGLQLALVRADFTLGQVYAETVLAVDPENADANFAMGMYYQQQRQLTRAEEYLKRCLVRKPDEPAVFNNLAMIQIELGKLAAARINVEKALKRLPHSTVVQDTRRKLEAAEAARRESSSR